MITAASIPALKPLVSKIHSGSYTGNNRNYSLKTISSWRTAKMRRLEETPDDEHGLARAAGSGPDLASTQASGEAIRLDQCSKKDIVRTVDVSVRSQATQQQPASSCFDNPVAGYDHV